MNHYSTISQTSNWANACKVMHINACRFFCIVYLIIYRHIQTTRLPKNMWSVTLYPALYLVWLNTNRSTCISMHNCAYFSLYSFVRRVSTTLYMGNWARETSLSRHDKAYKIWRCIFNASSCDQTMPRLEIATLPDPSIELFPLNKGRLSNIQPNVCDAQGKLDVEPSRKHHTMGTVLFGSGMGNLTISCLIVLTGARVIQHNLPGIWPDFLGVVNVEVVLRIQHHCKLGVIISQGEA